MGPFSLDFMLANRRRFVEMISRHYPLSREALDRFACVLSWPLLSCNDAIPWSPSLIQAHAPRWDWISLMACLEQRAARDRDMELLRTLIELGPAQYDLARRLEGCIGDREPLELAPPLANPAVAVMLDPDVVEAFLHACARPMDTPRNPGLEQAIAAAPDDPAGYDAYAGWLEEQRDAQAEVIQAMRGVERGVVAPAAAARVTAAYAEQLGIEHELSWRSGFVRKAAWFRGCDGGDWRLTLRLRPFAFVEELRIHDGVHHGFGHYDRARMSDADWELLASLPCLTRLALHEVAIEPTSKLRELVRITHLDLFGSQVFDLSVFAGMPALRSLVLHEDAAVIFEPGVDLERAGPLVDLGLLASIPKLMHLDLRGSDARCDLEPLRACPRLETLQVGCQHYDVLGSSGILDRLARLRRLFVPCIAEPDLATLRARHPRLAINGHDHEACFGPTDVDGWARVPAEYHEEHWDD